MSARNTYSAVALTALLLAPSACGSTDDPPGDTPSAPAENDPAYSIDGFRDWYLVGNDLTPGNEELAFLVEPPDGTDYIDMWLNDEPGERLDLQDGQHYRIMDITDLPAGVHEILLAANGSDTAFARVTFNRTHPLYVIVTTDWDDADTADSALALQDDLHSEHEDLLLTHFVGPYTFTDSTVTPERREVLVDWLLNQQDTYEDEIGLHIHPYCNFVETTSVTCRHMPSTTNDNGDPTGYTVMLSSYTEAELIELFEKSDELFLANGLPKPTSFRAGGWTADTNVLKAMEATGHVADTSANNWARMEEWENQLSGVLYEWNKTQWATIDDTSQPYYPNEDDILSADAPNIGVLEVPDNGILVDYVSADEMIEIFHTNWPDGAPLLEPTQFSIGFHPSNFNLNYKTRMTNALTEVNRYRARLDRGPVVFARLSDVVQVWKRP
jgi:hypothetical protein